MIDDDAKDILRNKLGLPMSTDEEENQLTFCLFTILIVVISAPQVSSEDELVQLLELSNTQISDEDSKTMPLVEFFFSPGYENVTSELHQLEDVANVIHWRISAEEEGLNWPNDDANIQPTNYPFTTILQSSSTATSILETTMLNP